MTNRMIASAIALAAIASSQAAQAQQQACINPADLSDAVIYAMPMAFDAARTTCTNRLSKNGFMATKGDAFIAPYRTAQNTAWPGALRVIKAFMADKARGEDGADTADMSAMIASMPESALRPLIDAFVGQMIAEKIKPASCSKIERGIELVSPLPAENVGGLATFLIELGEIKDPMLCSATASVPRK